MKREIIMRPSWNEYFMDITEIVKNVIHALEIQIAHNGVNINGSTL